MRHRYKYIRDKINPLAIQSVFEVMVCLLVYLFVVNIGEGLAASRSVLVFNGFSIVKLQQAIF